MKETFVSILWIVFYFLNDVCISYSINDFYSMTDNWLDIDYSKAIVYSLKSTKSAIIHVSLYKYDNLNKIYFICLNWQYTRCFKKELSQLLDNLYLIYFNFFAAPKIEVIDSPNCKDSFL